jgi:hypothetical protein
MGPERAHHELGSDSEKSARARATSRTYVDGGPSLPLFRGTSDYSDAVAGSARLHRASATRCASVAALALVWRLFQHDALGGAQESAVPSAHRTPALARALQASARDRQRLAKAAGMRHGVSTGSRAM